MRFCAKYILTLGNTCLSASSAQSSSGLACISEENTNLAVINLPQATAVLPCNPIGFIPLLFDAAFVQDQCFHLPLWAEELNSLLSYPIHKGLIIPGGGDEMTQRLIVHLCEVVP